MEPWHAFSVFVFVLGTWTAGPLAALEPPSDPAPGAPHRLTLQSPAEAGVREVLDQPTEFEFTDTPISEVIAALKAKHQIEVRLDPNVLEEQGVEPDPRITGSAKGVPLRRALRHLLGPRYLAFIVQDNVLLITTRESEAEHLLTCIYPVNDLLPTRAPSGELQADYATLIALITSTVDPLSWDDVGGTGTITAVENRMCLAISQTDNAHEQIDQLLATLRRIPAKGELLPPRRYLKQSPPSSGCGGGMFNLDSRSERE